MNYELMRPMFEAFQVHKKRATVGDEAHDLGYPNMFSDMFNAIEEGRDAKETFYDVRWTPKETIGYAPLMILAFYSLVLWSY